MDYTEGLRRSLTDHSSRNVGPLRLYRASRRLEAPGRDATAKTAAFAQLDKDVPNARWQTRGKLNWPKYRLNGARAAATNLRAALWQGISPSATCWNCRDWITTTSYGMGQKQ